MIEYGRDQLGLRSILARPIPQTLASIALLEKLGFVLTEERISKGLPTSFFELREAS